MINHLSIKNFAIIEDAEINFNKGLNIITGESGSGKSVVLEAMSLALGCRADSSYIRTGAEKAVIQMVAEYLHTDYVITRELTANGKNICKINGEIVTLSKLQELTTKIADIHGQYDNQSLLNPECHIDLIDKYEMRTIKVAKQKVAELYSRYVDINKIIENKKTEFAQFKEKKDLMEYQLNEIQSANLISGEDIELNDKLLEEQNKEKIFLGFQEINALCNNDERPLTSQITAISKILKDIKRFSKEASELEYDFTDIYYRIQELTTKVRRINDRVSYSSDNLDAIIERLDIINDLKRKYDGSIDDILNYAENLESSINKIHNMDSDISSHLIEKERIEEMLKSATETLSELRKRSAKALEERVQKELQDLNFNDVTISMSIEKTDTYSANGVDKIEFLISTNKGEPLKPLAKIASGGEMSRIMLAFKSVIGEYENIETMIFDEIDSGISGQAATVVADKLLEISNKHQIIAITHLPQIAALGNHNYKVYKTTTGDTTKATIKHLSEQEKIREIAVLISGNSISDIALENAKYLVNNR